MNTTNAKVLLFQAHEQQMKLAARRRKATLTLPASEVQAAMDKVKRPQFTYNGAVLATLA